MEQTNPLIERKPSVGPEKSPRNSKYATRMHSYANFFLYTKSVPSPRIRDTVRTMRFLVRLAQFCCSKICFAALATSAFNVNYPFYVLGSSGINFTVLTAISSLFVTVSCMTVYLFPAFLGVLPQRHERYSRIEVTTDLMLIVFWIISSSALAHYGDCPRNMFLSDGSRNDDCLAWNLSFAFGFVTAFFFLVTFFLGVRDLWIHRALLSGKHRMKARGNWRDWGSDENLDAPPQSSKQQS